MAAVKLPPLRKIVRAMATAAYEQEEAARATPSRLSADGHGQRSGHFAVVTTAWMAADTEAEDERPKDLLAMKPAIGTQ
jgi:hypothetical protein